MEINSTILLRSSCRKLTEFLELLDKIPDADFQEINRKIREHPKHIKSIQDAIANSNPFMTVFFLKELIEILTHEIPK